MLTIFDTGMFVHTRLLAFGSAPTRSVSANLSSWATPLVAVAFNAAVPLEGEDVAVAESGVGQAVGVDEALFVLVAAAVEAEGALRTGPAIVTLHADSLSEVAVTLLAVSANAVSV